MTLIHFFTKTNQGGFVSIWEAIQGGLATIGKTAMTWWSSGDLWRLFVDIATLLLAIAAIYIAKHEWNNTSHQRRRENFKILGEMQANDSTRIQNSLRSAPRNPRDRHLIYEDLLVTQEWHWISGQPLVPLGQVKLTPSVEVRNHHPIRKAVASTGILPNPKMTLTDNLLLFSGDRSYDAPSYALDSNPNVNFAKGTVELVVRQGSYFEFIDTCICYGYEAADALLGQSPSKLLLRQKFALSDFTNRHAQIGIVTLVVIREMSLDGSSKSWLLLQKRSSDVTESANLENAVPGATFQPTHIDSSGQLTEAALKEALFETVVREFCEEVLGTEEFSECTSGASVRARPEWDLLKDKTYFLGMGINPLNPYIELLCLASIDMRSDLAREAFGGRTVEHLRSSIKANHEGTIELKPFDEETLRHYSHQYRAAPALRQLCKITLDGLTDPDFRRILGIDSTTSQYSSRSAPAS